MRTVRGVSTLLLALACVVVTACASTQIVNQWSDPAYTGPAFKKVIVIGVSKQPSVRRTFEDQFVAQLRAVGVDAVPSYEYMEQDGPVEEGLLKSAMSKAGVDAAIVTRLVNKEQKTQVTGGYYAPMPGYGFYGGYSSAWVGFYDPPTVYQYDVYYSETSFYDLKTEKVVWSGTAETTAPGNIQKESAAYAKLMIDALRKKHLV